MIFRPFLFVLIGTTASLAIASHQLSGYPSARPNHNLKNEVENDSDRLFPAYDKATFAVDGEAWFRPLGTKDFYHGFGHWTQVRAEVRPNHFFAINARSIFYSGSSSEGYANPIGFYSLIGLTGIWPEKIWNSTLKLRIIDIERQTVGVGLLIQDREMNGALLTLSNDFYLFKLRGDSTGALISEDDFVNPELSLFNGWLGFGAGVWTASKEQSNLSRNRYAYYYLMSEHPIWEPYFYSLEFGRRENANAGMVSINMQKQINAWSLNSKVEYRKYQSQFGKDFVRQIENQYISYDQMDKAYTNAMNVFVTDDDAQVYAFHLDINYEFNHYWRLDALNEIGRFDFQKTDDKSYYFYRYGVTYCPLVEREDCINIFVSNKVLNDSYYRPPSEVSRNNVELFKEISYIGFEGRFRF